jgi:hypothetical protein
MSISEREVDGDTLLHSVMLVYTKLCIMPTQHLSSAWFDLAMFTGSVSLPWQNMEGCAGAYPPSRYLHPGYSLLALCRPHLVSDNCLFLQFDSTEHVHTTNARHSLQHSRQSNN